MHLNPRCSCVRYPVKREHVIKKQGELKYYLSLSPFPAPQPSHPYGFGLLGPVNVLFIPLKPGSSFPMITGVGDGARGRRSSCAAALPCGPALQVKRAAPCNTGLRRPVCWQDTESNSNAATSLGEEHGIEYARESCRAQRDRPAPGLQSVPVLPQPLSAAPVAM